MKQLIKFTFIAIISSFMTLLGSKYVEGKDKVTIIHQNESSEIIPTNNLNNNVLNTNADFTEAAEKTRQECIVEIDGGVKLLSTHESPCHASWNHPAHRPPPDRSRRFSRIH